MRKNQRHVGKLNELQTADMIKVTAVLPGARKISIQKGIEALHGKNDATFLKSWGVEVSTEMSVIDARILPAPAMTMHPKSQGGATNTVRDGQWRYGQGKMFAQPAPLKCWGTQIISSIDLKESLSLEDQMLSLLNKFLLSFQVSWIL